MLHLFKNWGDQRFRWLRPGDGSLIGSTYRWVQWWYGTGGATLGAFVLVLSFPLAQQGSHRDGHLVKNLGHGNTVDERNPANQLRLVVYPIIYRVLYIPGGAGCLNHQQYHWWNHVPYQDYFRKRMANELYAKLYLLFDFVWGVGLLEIS